jgi:hypothetical protein
MSTDSRKDSDTDRHAPIFEDGSNTHDTLKRVEIIVSVIQRPRAEG